MTRSSIVVAVALVACGTPADPSPPQPATYRITPLQLWAGNTVTVESQAFRDLGEGAGLRLGQDTVPLVRVDDTTMTATFPSTAGGVYDPVVVMGDSLAPVAQVVVWGFAATRPFGPGGIWLPWDLYVWPRDEPQIIGGNLGGALVILNLATEEIITQPGLSNHQTLRGPGATPDDSVFLFRPPGQVLQSWKLGPNPVKVGEHPEIPGTRQVLRLGLHSWLVTWNNRIEVWRRADSSASYAIAASYPMNEPQGLHLSPRKDRATVRANWAGGVSNLIPVFDVPSGDLAFHAPIPSAMGIDWSADGATLAIVGAQQPSSPSAPGTILLLNATSGAVLASTTTSRRVFAVAFDDRNPYLYVGVTSATGRPALQVYQRPNLTLLAEMDVPSTDPDCGIGPICDGGVIALDDEHVYVFYGWNGPTRASRFFRPP